MSQIVAGDVELEVGDFQPETYEAIASSCGTASSVANTGGLKRSAQDRLDDIRRRVRARAGDTLTAESPAPEARCGGHRLMLTDTITWCFLCGGYVEQKRCMSLSDGCNRAPTSSGMRGGLGRLKAGKHPKTGVLLTGEARRLTIAEIS